MNILTDSALICVKTDRKGQTVAATEICKILNNGKDKLSGNINDLSMDQGR